MQKIILGLLSLFIIGSLTSCLQTPSLNNDQAAAEFGDSNSNIDPSTGLPYVNQPSAPDQPKAPTIASGSSPSTSGGSPTNPSNSSGSSPAKSSEEQAAADLQKQIDEDNAKDLALFAAQQKAQEEEQAEQSTGSGQAPVKQAARKK